jgi:hypothetical protein
MSKIAYRIYEHYFKGAGEYRITIDGAEMLMEVDHNGIFYPDDSASQIPLYAFARRVGSKNDRPYRRAV